MPRPVSTTASPAGAGAGRIDSQFFGAPGPARAIPHVAQIDVKNERRIGAWDVGPYALQRLHKTGQEAPESYGAAAKPISFRGVGHFHA